MATSTMAKTKAPMTEEQTASMFAGTLIYKALLEAGEPLKANDIAKMVGRADFDSKLTRVALVTNPHMTAVDRKWTLWSRYLDSRRTLDFNLQRVLNAFGQPVQLPHLANELHSIYGRPMEIYEEMLERMTKDSDHFFTVGKNSVALSSWLLDTEAEIDDEVLFDNFIRDEEIAESEAAAKSSGISAGSPESIGAFLNEINKPVRAKVAQYFAWRSDKEGFNAKTFYENLFLHSGGQALMDGTWIGTEYAKTLAGNFAVLAQQEVSDTAEAEAQEAAKPLVIGDSELETLIDMVLDNEETSHAAQMLEDVFEVMPDFRTYEGDLNTVIAALAADDRVIWLGTDRFRPLDSLPAYIYTVPGLLEIPEHHFADLEGNVIDQLLEDEGFDGGLDREIVSPLAQDVLDEEPIGNPDANPPSNARAVVKYHHKQIGTLPLCLFPAGFFPQEPVVLETEFLLPTGQKATVWVNNETRLLYGLIDWFEGIPIDSGATFTLERKLPDLYAINYSDETEPNMFNSRNRLNELILLQERAESEQLATFELVREIMEHYRKGIEFITLHTEVNIVRRETRRMVASVLSEYHCFFQRGGAWVYDAKKLTLGFDKSKKKFIHKA